MSSKNAPGTSAPPEREGDRTAVSPPAPGTVACRDRRAPGRPATTTPAYPSNGAAELAAYLASIDGGLDAPDTQAFTPSFAPSLQPTPVSAGRSRAVLGIGLVVGMAIVAGAVYLVASRLGSESTTTARGDRGADATTVAGEGTAFSTLWKVDGYRLVDADPSVLAEASAARDELLPSMRGAFRETQVKKVELNGRPAGYVVAHTLDPIVVDDAAFTGSMLSGMSQALSGPTDAMVGGNPATYGGYDDFSGFITIKKDVLLFVIGESRATIEPLLASLLANIA